MAKKYIVQLRRDERDRLTKTVSTVKAAAYKIKHANILLKSDAGGPNWSAAQVASAFSCAQQTGIQRAPALCDPRLGCGLGG